MRFTEYTGPALNRGKTGLRLEQELTEFMNMNVKVAEVAFTEREYKNSKSCYTSLYGAVRRYALPISVSHVGGRVFLIRKDI